MPERITELATGVRVLTHKCERCERWGSFGFVIGARPYWACAEHRQAAEVAFCKVAK
jgi:hypothetical protein